MAKKKVKGGNQSRAKGVAPSTGSDEILTTPPVSSKTTGQISSSNWETFSKRHYWKILGAILCLALSLRLVRLEVPADFYFDEVYHGFTAKRYLHAERDAYDPWGKAPEGRANEWTHPPLGKLLMSAGMLVAGETSFGWRLSSALLGTASIALTATIGLALFGSAIVALFAALLLTLEGLFLVQSRIAMIDVHFVFFMLLTCQSLLRLLKTSGPAKAIKTRDIFLVGIFLGLSAATKWTALYLFAFVGAILLLALLQGRFRPTWPQWCLAPLALFLLPAVIYFLSYAHYFSLGFSFAEFKELQRQMWWYHTNLKATHSYSSKPWQWVLDLRPVWMYVSYATPGKIANIYNLGNPIILWAGALASGICLFRLIKNFSNERFFLLLAYFIMWLPWVFSPRINLFYHYTPAIPFLCLLLSYELLNPSKLAWKIRRGLAFSLAFLATTWLIIFYPHLTALPMPRQFVDAVYFALPGWK